MKSINISKEKNIEKEKGGGYMSKEIKGNVPIQGVSSAPLPTFKQIQNEVQKFSTKYNAKTLLEQESTEALQRIISMSLQTIETLEKKLADIEEKLSENSK